MNCIIFLIFIFIIFFIFVIFMIFMIFVIMIVIVIVIVIVVDHVLLCLKSKLLQMMEYKVLHFDSLISNYIICRYNVFDIKLYIISNNYYITGLVQEALKISFISITSL